MFPDAPVPQCAIGCMICFVSSMALCTFLPGVETTNNVILIATHSAQFVTFFAGLAGFAVPIDVGGDRLAFMATASDADVPAGSYLAGPTGSKGYTRGEGFDDGIVSAEARDDSKAAALWVRSCEIVGC